MLSGATHIAMQYSPDCSIPYISTVDAGTVELVRSFGLQVVSSANLVQEFEARWTEGQLGMHLEAGRRVDRIRRAAFDFIGERTRASREVSEYEVQQFILGSFAHSELVTDHGPIVAVNEHASDPHFEPSPEDSRRIQAGDLVLIDMWAKLADPKAVYYDITWTGFCGDEIPSPIQNVFHIVREARKAACRFIIDAVTGKRRIAGFEVDDVARGVISQAGFGEFFFHRTGHNIGTDVHGTGANMDNLESHDDRVILPNTCFSIEPGIYVGNFGIRSEVNMYVGEETATVTGEEQTAIVRI
jgi:Xaa-Pro aminopeptidase